VRSASEASHNRVLVASLLGFTLLMAACTVGPKYQRPPVVAPPEYKETGQWKPAQPSDQLAKGKWWEIYQDPQLNALEEQISVSNQTLKASQAQYAQARALVRFNRSNLFPTVTANPSVNRNHLSQHRPLSTALAGTTYNDLILPMDVSYEPDLWGRIRRTVEQSRENAQASAADLENVSLSLHAELAIDYFLMRSLEAEQQLLQSTVAAYAKALELTQNRYRGGVASQVDVAQAQTQLETTRALAIDDELSRAQFEHAIAVLVGKPPASFSLPANPLNAPPPIIPPGLPSELLERRPDIAAFERQMAAANSGIGIAKAAYYPIVNLGASGGFESATAGLLLNGTSGFWSLGGSALQTVFDAGRRRAVTQQAQATYDQTVANYRQTVLSAFQEVEDNLAAQRILADEAETQQAAVAAADQSLALSLNRYRGGVTTYLEVITAQSIALSDERAGVQILGRRMAASVQLIKALGGGWDTKELPSLQAVGAVSAGH
jgi:NodT family efflux transporter outer membrane factor (OMF) lipoprotein